MKKLNALAFCAVLGFTYALGIGTVLAADRDKACETDQGAGETISGQQESVPTTENRDWSGTEDTRNSESRQQGSADAENATGNDDRHCGALSKN